MNEPYRPTVRNQADLEEVWRHLMQPLGFVRHSIWMMLIEADDRPVPQLTEIDTDEMPPSDVGESLADLFAHLLAPGSAERLAFLRSRPGRGGVAAGDRAWARCLYDACRTAGVGCEVVHLATDVDVLPLPFDAVGLPAA